MWEQKHQVADKNSIKKSRNQELSAQPGFTTYLFFGFQKFFLCFRQSRLHVNHSFLQLLSLIINNIWVLQQTGEICFELITDIIGLVTFDKFSLPVNELQLYMYPNVSIVSALLNWIFVH